MVIPARRLRWTPAELSYLTQLHAEGIEVDLEPLRESNRSSLRISHAPDLGHIFDLDPLNTGYVVPVHLVSSSRVYLEDCWIESDWHSRIELVEFDEGRGKFGPRTFRPEEVLNSKFEERAAFNRGRVVEGYLLAWSDGLIPSNVRNGSYWVQVTIVDTLGRSSTADLPILLERHRAAEDASPYPAVSSAKVPRPVIPPTVVPQPTVSLSAMRRSKGLYE